MDQTVETFLEFLWEVLDSSMTGEWYQDTLGRRSMIDFVVVSSDLFKSYFRENFSQILREAGDIDSGWTMFFASIFNAASSEPGGGSKECH